LIGDVYVAVALCGLRRFLKIFQDKKPLSSVIDAYFHVVVSYFSKYVPVPVPSN
jgi:hypothetical protein